MPDFSLELEAMQSCSGNAAPLMRLANQPSLFDKPELSSQLFIAGVDEAGCGPWAGPVVAGAVIFPEFDKVPKDLLELLDDSKKMTEKRRDKAYDLLRQYEDTHCYIGSGQTSETEIDDINIRQAALLAMKRAVEELPVKPHFALIDGISSPRLSCSTQTFKKGDGRSFSIAAASIIAKVERDRLMTDLAKQYPEYLWEKNAGYGTKAHQEALVLHGVTPHHRKSFAPIAKLLQEAREAA